MRTIVVFLTGLFAGGAIAFMVENWSLGAAPSLTRVDATYFPQVEDIDLERFASGVPTADGQLVSAGRVVGATSLTTVRHRGGCGTQPEIEAYLAAFLRSDRFICYEARYRN